MKKAARAAGVRTAADASSSAEPDGWVVRQMSDHLHFNEFLICFFGIFVRYPFLALFFFAFSFSFLFFPEPFES